MKEVNTIHKVLDADKCYRGGKKGKEYRKFAAEEREFVHSALAEANTKHQELQPRKIGYLIMNDTT